MFETFRNAWHLPDLRRKILFTLFILVIFRVGSAIPVPFIDVAALGQAFEELGNTMVGLMDMMSGSAFSHATIFALSIQPYINASIIMNLLTVGIPALERMVKEGGDEGRKKIASITRYATVGLGLLQGFAFYMLIARAGLVTPNNFWSATVIVISFTAGTAFIMWLGEQITEFGIGNGISIILFASIVSRGPSMIDSASKGLINGTLSPFAVIAVIVLAIAIVAFIVYINSAERRVPVQYAKRVVGRKMYGGQTTHLPLKVNMSGVMPIIFAQSISTFPATIAAFFPKPDAGSFWEGFLKAISHESILYAIVYFLLIIAFSYFYTSIQFNPIEIANNIKRNGGYIPGFRPGKPTSDFIQKILRKITLFGAIFLGIIAILPIIMNYWMQMPGLALGGTSVLIVVGVALETMRQMESQMLMRHYKGFLE